MEAISSFQFYKETEFKEVELDGRVIEIPKDWEIVRLGNCADIIMGQSPPSFTYNTEGKGLPFLQGCAEFGETYPKPTVYCSNPIKVAEANDILLSVRAPVGEVNIAPFKCCVGRGLSAIRTKEDRLHYLFLFYYLKLNSKVFEKIATGSTFKAIKKNDIENYLIPLPPLEEQKKIAHVLRTMDNAIKIVEKAIEKLERIKKATMEQLLTKGIGHKEFKMVELDGRTIEIPKDWEVAELGKVCTQRKEIVLPEGKGKYRFIGLEHIESGRITLSNYGHDSDVKSSKFKFYPGDILYGKLRPYLDKAVLVNFEGICSTDLIVLTPKTNFAIPEFLIYVIHSNEFINYAISTMSGTNHPRTSWKAISKFKFPLPPLEEQKQIAKILKTIDEAIELKKKKKEKLERMKKAVMDKLLTGKVRVR